MTRLREVLTEAEAFVTRVPTEKAGLLFLKDGPVVGPDPDRLQEYQTHAGKRPGHWPSSLEITAAMLDLYFDITREQINGVLEFAARSLDPIPASIPAANPSVNAHSL